MDASACTWVQRGARWHAILRLFDSLRNTILLCPAALACVLVLIIIFIGHSPAQVMLSRSPQPARPIRASPPFSLSLHISLSLHLTSHDQMPRSCTHLDHHIMLPSHHQRPTHLHQDAPCAIPHTPATPPRPAPLAHKGRFCSAGAEPVHAADGRKRGQKLRVVSCALSTAGAPNTSASNAPQRPRDDATGATSSPARRLRCCRPYCSWEDLLHAREHKCSAACPAYASRPPYAPKNQECNRSGPARPRAPCLLPQLLRALSARPRAAAAGRPDPCPPLPSLLAPPWPCR